jgi:DNA polymerase III delta prime subunit
MGGVVDGEEYNHKHQYKTTNNALGIKWGDAWNTNLQAPEYREDGLTESWFEHGLSCIHFANGNTKNGNIAWAKATLHLSTDAIGPDVPGMALEVGLNVDREGAHYSKITGLKLCYFFIGANGHGTKNDQPKECQDDGKYSNLGEYAISVLDDKTSNEFKAFYDTIVKYLSDLNQINKKGEYMLPDPQTSNLASVLKKSKNIIFHGAPGTGKTYLAKAIAADIVSNGAIQKYTQLSNEQKKQIEFVQFHPSYDYTDFVEGLRPKVNDDGSMGFELQDGIFKKFVAEARKSQNTVKDNLELKPFSCSEAESSLPFVFIIDEINRGEISKIFGELFFAVDPGYRGKVGEVSTQYANLHENPEDKFFIPDNVYIIGTMNDIDRSVDSFDFAMRRRFRFIEIKAGKQLGMLDMLNEKKDEAIRRMASLNKAISAVEGLNENYHIGAAYFLKLETLGFEQLWTDYLAPLLQDYIRGMYEEKEKLAALQAAYELKSKETGEQADVSNDANED